MPYDIFISFKNTDAYGRETRDAAIAEDLFRRLTEQGLSVFFSKAILVERGAAAYKAAIETALDEARVLVAVSTEVEYINSEWVAYERESFHNDILSGRKKNACIVPYLQNIHDLDVPRSLRNYQTFQIDASPASDVVDFIKRFLHAGEENGQAVAEESELSLVTGKHLSTYSAQTREEFKRLKIQSVNTREADFNALRYVTERLGTDEGLRILDMGSAYGFVTKDRFSRYAGATVLGVDRGEELINFARENNTFDGAHYDVLDLECEDFEEKIEALMEAYNIEEFDIIFASLVLHHLKNPQKLLRRVRRYLSREGFIIIRGSDDGSILTHNDDGLIQKILDIHLSADGISDRMNGRKIYSQLISSGYKNVVMKSWIKDLSGLSLDERNDVFFERFAYRKNYIKKLADKDPYDAKKRADLKNITFYLNELENKFDDETFWYCEVDFVGIAQKR